MALRFERPCSSRCIPSCLSWASLLSLSGPFRVFLSFAFSCSQSAVPLPPSSPAPVGASERRNSGRLWPRALLTATDHDNPANLAELSSGRAVRRGYHAAIGGHARFGLDRRPAVAGIDTPCSERGRFARRGRDLRPVRPRLARGGQRRLRSHADPDRPGRPHFPPRRVVVSTVQQHTAPGIDLNAQRLLDGCRARPGEPTRILRGRHRAGRRRGPGRGGAARHPRRHELGGGGPRRLLPPHPAARCTISRATAGPTIRPTGGARGQYRRLSAHDLLLCGEAPVVQMHYYLTHPQSYYGTTASPTMSPASPASVWSRNSGMFQSTRAARATSPWGSTTRAPPWTGRRSRTGCTTRWSVP